MNKRVKRQAKKIRTPRAFPGLRGSRSAQQSFAAELNRLHAMSIEERILEALGMNERFSGLAAAPKER